MDSDDVIDLHAQVPVQDLALDSVEREMGHWLRCFRQCWHGKGLGTCDNPDCTVEFVMIS